MKIICTERIPEPADALLVLGDVSSPIWCKNETGFVTITIPEKPNADRVVALRALRFAVRTALAEKRTHLQISEQVLVVYTGIEITDALTHLLFASYAYSRKTGVQAEELVTYLTVSKDRLATRQKELRSAEMVARALSVARNLANTPGGEMTPLGLAKSAVDLFKKSTVSVNVLAKKELQKEKMGAILGVGAGSEHEPCLIVMEYRGGKKGEAPVVLVGKGITFDSGGLNVKPSDGMYEMHMDMAGGAAVIGTMKALADLKVRRNVIGLVPAAENMPSGSSYRPGDILTTHSGKTVEVLNTDAEGRLVLADALSYAKKWKPAVIIDVATLTGAACAALGLRASALFSNTDKLILSLMDSAEKAGERLWPMPLWHEYAKEVEGTFADLQNVGKSRYGGAITGAKFLEAFVEKGTPWAHLDIAPRMVSIDDDNLAKGATGTPLLTLLAYLTSDR